MVALVEDEDEGLGAGYWRFAAYAFGALGAICWISFALLLGDETREPTPTPWLWMAGGVSFIVFSAACAVLNAVKSMEARLRADASA
jgi:hypothetical protein